MSFNEQSTVNEIKSILKSAFNTTAWKNAFGGKTMKFTDDNFGEVTSFPVIYFDISDCSMENGTYDSSQDEKYTRVWFDIEQYNQAVGTTSKKTLGRSINKHIIDTLRNSLNPTITKNSELVSPDDTIYRRAIEGYFIIENETQTIYR